MDQQNERKKEGYIIISLSVGFHEPVAGFTSVGTTRGQRAIRVFVVVLFVKSQVDTRGALIKKPFAACSLLG